MKGKIFLVVFAIFILAGGIWFFNNRLLSQPGETKPPSTPSETKTEEQKEGIFGSIRQALEKSVNLKCQYQLENGDKMTVYLKGKDLIRAEVTTKQNQQTTTIMKDDKMWFWLPATKKGMMISLAGLQQQGLANQQVPNKEKILEEAEKYKETCQPATIANSLFEIPQEVEFENLDELLKKAK